MVLHTSPAELLFHRRWPYEGYDRLDVREGSFTIRILPEGIYNPSGKPLNPDPQKSSHREWRSYSNRVSPQGPCTWKVGGLILDSSGLIYSTLYSSHHWVSELIASIQRMLDQISLNSWLYLIPSPARRIWDGKNTIKWFRYSIMTLMAYTGETRCCPKDLTSRKVLTLSVFWRPIIQTYLKGRNGSLPV